MSRKRNVFDLGAHQGIIASVIAKQVGHEGKVVAVECSRFTEKNLAANHIENVIVVHAIVSAHGGIGKFVDNGNGYITRNRKEKTVSVESRTIDNFSEEFRLPDLILMDIEGAEFVVLRNSALLSSKETEWSIELHGDDLISSYGGSNKDVVQLFLSKNFEVYKFDTTSIPPKYLPLDSPEETPIVRTHIFCRPIRS